VLTSVLDDISMSSEFTYKFNNIRVGFKPSVMNRGIDV
jgi:hypothetical protein